MRLILDLLYNKYCTSETHSPRCENARKEMPEEETPQLRTYFQYFNQFKTDM